MGFWKQKLLENFKKKLLPHNHKLLFSVFLSTLFVYSYAWWRRDKKQKRDSINQTYYLKYSTNFSKNLAFKLMGSSLWKYSKFWRRIFLRLICILTRMRVEKRVGINGFYCASKFLFYLVAVWLGEASKWFGWERPQRKMHVVFRKF